MIIVDQIVPIGLIYLVCDDPILKVRSANFGVRTWICLGDMYCLIIPVFLLTFIPNLALFGPASCPVVLCLLQWA